MRERRERRKGKRERRGERMHKGGEVYIEHLRENRERRGGERRGVQAEREQNM